MWRQSCLYRMKTTTINMAHSIFFQLTLYLSSFSVPNFICMELVSLSVGHCKGVIASLPYRSWRFWEKIKEVFAISLHRPDRKFSEALGLDRIPCVGVYALFLPSPSFAAIVSFKTVSSRFATLSGLKRIVSRAKHKNRKMLPRFNQMLPREEGTFHIVMKSKPRTCVTRQRADLKWVPQTVSWVDTAEALRLPFRSALWDWGIVQLVGCLASVNKGPKLESPVQYNTGYGSTHL